MNQPSPIIWKLKQLWLKTRCHLSPYKALVYPFGEGVKFVAHLDDLSSQDIFIKRGYESKEIQWCSSWLRNRETFVDCGANIGFYSACLRQLRNANVYAVEGNQTCFDRCSATFDLLSLKDITLIHAILHSDSSKSLCIPDLPGKEGLQYVSEVAEQAAQCPTLTLDELTVNEVIKPTLIKIDCEGAETEILKGATNLLESVRPAWLIEINDHALNRSGTSREELFKIMKDSSYRLFHVASAFAPHSFGLEIDHTFESWSFNMAAIPDDPSSNERWLETKAQFV